MGFIKCMQLRGQFQNQSLIGWLKKMQNREQNFIICKSNIHNCITSPHSCHPYLGTCCTVTPVFVVLIKERCHQIMQPDVDSIHELFVGVEALGSQPDLHLGESMVITWCQIQTVRWVVENLPVEELN